MRAAEPFDTSKPNSHENKAEFIAEYEAVQSCIEAIQTIFDALLPAEDDPLQKAMQARLGGIINSAMRENAERLTIDTPASLARQNISITGGLYGSLFVLVDLSSALTKRFQDLKNQEAQFWSQPNRAPDPYARAIALRLARLYANTVGERPTVGTSPETGEPSTHYTRALQDVYELLGIKRRARTQATWAVKQITDDDLNPPSPLVNALMRLRSPTNPPQKSPTIAELLAQQTRKK